MVFGIIGLIAGAAGLPLSASSAPTSAQSVALASAGTAQSASTQSGGASDKNAPADGTQEKLDPRLAKFNITVTTNSTSSRRSEIEGKKVVLTDGKLYVAGKETENAHPFSGFYIDYPFKTPALRGLVSTIRPDPPELNWIFVDRTSLQVRYGNKTSSIEHFTGPWDWTSEGLRVTFDNYEAFCAMEESPGKWVLCYDMDDDRLARLRSGRRVLDCYLHRQLI
jgi:hypothetical protein